MLQSTVCMQASRATSNGAAGRWRLRRRHESHHGPSILYVEDNEDTRLIVCEVLTGEGYEVTTASTVQEGLDALEAASSGFALILTDYSLPDGTGLDMLATATERKLIGDEIPRVLFTGEPNLGQLEEGITLVRKPLRVRNLLDTLEGLLADRLRSYSL